MSGRMFDTNVVLHALNKHLTADEELAQKRADCSAAIVASEEIYISTVSMMEFYPHMTAKEREAYDEIRGRVSHVPFTGAAANLAARLFEKYRKQEKVCRICASLEGSSPCKGCGAVRSFHSRRNDFCIAASAAVDPDVDVLFTYDFLYLAPALAGMVDVCEPPNAAGKLFAGEPLTEEDVAPARKKRPKPPA